ncbi:hypothetical protein B0T25DRAFT_611827 [Lasiosphaeria hispida]|uniref:Uncharacterized protein n=1 Tax=Lasiosphaeria hispida TaxID=260671 RepID=A0AAJ0HA64_9PEZI|nr:hypothetical protein B0T25DRAFT_611827 [Lasiosphaeria hispida]
MVVVCPDRASLLRSFRLSPKLTTHPRQTIETTLSHSEVTIIEMASNNSTPAKGKGKSQAKGNLSDAIKDQKDSGLFTYREQEIILNAMLSIKEFPAVDYTELSRRLGFANPRSAGNAWAGVKRKVTDIHETEGNKEFSEAIAQAKKVGPGLTRVKTDAASTPAKKGGAAAAKADGTKHRRRSPTPEAEASSDKHNDAVLPAPGDADFLPPAAKRAKKADDTAEGDKPKKAPRKRAPRVKKEPTATPAQRQMTSFLETILNDKPAAEQEPAIKQEAQGFVKQEPGEENGRGIDMPVPDPKHDELYPGYVSEDDMLAYTV